VLARVAAPLAVQLEAEAAAEEGNSWGIDDLIDIDADEDDWSRFSRRFSFFVR
jgi:hypothetical protein